MSKQPEEYVYTKEIAEKERVTSLRIQAVELALQTPYAIAVTDLGSQRNPTDALLDTAEEIYNFLNNDQTVVPVTGVDAIHVSDVLP
jgi:hypothetical protein